MDDFNPHHNHNAYEDYADTMSLVESLDGGYYSASDATTSIASSVTDYKWENGRRYHSYSENAYFVPNDVWQNTQLEILHNIYTILLGRLYVSPIPPPKRVLDLGTGTGIWAIDMADQFPSSRILGNDLSPVQPTWIPGNCTFEVDDFNKPWVHQPSSFDFIFARDIYGSVLNWSRFLSEAFTALSPGGYYESVEMKVGCKSALFPEQHDEIPGTWAVKRWYLRGYEAARKTGRELDIAGNMEKWMRDAGFVDVEEKVLKIPVGAWDQSRRRIGKMMQRSLVDSAEGLCLALFTRFLGLTKEETLAIVGAAKEQLMDDSLKIYVEIFVTYGRKPYESDEGLDSGYGTSASSVALVNPDSPDEDSMDDMQ